MILFLLLVVIILAFLARAADKQNDYNRARYAPIRYRMVKNIRYPYWRLEEMLKEEQDKCSHD